MPVVLPFSIFLSSLFGLAYLINRRFGVIKKTLNLQKELEENHKKVVRAEKRKKVQHEKALNVIRTNNENRRTALENLGMINELMKKADFEVSKGIRDEAEKTLINVIALDPNHRKANDLLARLYLNLGFPKKAEIILKHLIELFPFDPEYVSLLGTSYLSRHQFRASIKAYEKALELDKNNGKRYQELGNVYAVKKEFKPALELFEQALRVEVSNIKLMFLMVELCLQNSDPIKAREYLHKILDYEPYNQEAKSLLGEVLRMLQAGGEKEKVVAGSL